MFLIKQDLDRTESVLPFGLPCEPRSRRQWSPSLNSTVLDRARSALPVRP